MIIVHKSVKHFPLPRPRTKLLEAISIEVILNNNQKVEFTSVYMPGSATTEQISQHYKNDIRCLTSTTHHYFRCGDWNSKHRLWNCNRANRAGHILYQEQSNRDFLILHSNEPTRYSSVVGQSPSTIDFVLTNSTLNTSELETLPSCSDHCYVTFSINFNEPVAPQQQRLIPCYRMADWDKYRDLVNIELNSRPFPELDDVQETSQVDEMVNFFTSSLLKAQQQSVPMVRPKHYSLMLSPAARRLIAEKHRLVRQLQRNPGLRNDIQPRLQFITAAIDQHIN